MTQIFTQDNDWRPKTRAFMSQFIAPCRKNPEGRCTGCETDMEGIIEYIETLMHHSAMVEKYAWLEGRRCSEAGCVMEPSETTTTCSNCLENA